MSIIRADSIKNRAGTGAPDFPNGITVTGIVTSTVLDASVTNLTVTGNLGVGGTVTYEDVSNVDSVGVITAREGIKVNGDNKKIILGAGDDFEIFHDGTTNRFQSNGLKTFQFNPKNTDVGLKIIGDGACELYHDGAKKLETTSSGVTVTGTLAATEFSGVTGVQQVAYANKVDTQAINYNNGRTVISGLNATLANAPASGNKLYISGQMTVGYSGGDPGTSPRWEFSTDNSSWNTVYLSTYMVAGSHSGLDANSNWGVGAGFKSWNDTWTVMCCTLNVMVTANEISNARYFRVTVRQTDNSNDTIYINRPGGGNLGFAPAGTSSLVVMEIKA